MVEIGATKPYESAQVHQRQGICRVRGRGRAPPDADWAPHRWRQPFQARCTIYGGVHRFLPPIRENVMQSSIDHGMGTSSGAANYKYLYVVGTSYARGKTV